MLCVMATNAKGVVHLCSALASAVAPSDGQVSEALTVAWLCLRPRPPAACFFVFDGFSRQLDLCSTCRNRFRLPVIWWDRCGSRGLSARSPRLPSQQPISHLHFAGNVFPL